MSSPKWSGKPKRFNPNRNFVMSDSNPARKFNPKSTFSPSLSSSDEIGASVSPPRAPASVSAIASPFMSPSGFTAHPQLAEADAAMTAPVGLPGSIPSIPSSEALEYASLYHPPLHPLQYQTYAPSPFRLHKKALEPHERSVDDFAVPADIRKELSERNEATLQILPSSTLPEFVHVYHSLVPLDLGQGNKEKQLWGVSAHRYKAISHIDGRTYCLLCIDDFEMTSENEHSLQVINKWKRVQSSGIVGVVEAFTTLAFASKQTQSATGGMAANSPGSAGSSMHSGAPGSASGSSGLASSFMSTSSSSSSSGGNGAADASVTSLGPGSPASKNYNVNPTLVVVYEWYPLCQQLSHYYDSINEQLLWKISVQVFSAIQAIHRRGLACRGVVHENFILIQGEDRARLGSLGVRDVLSVELGDVQSEDYKDLGRMLQRLTRPKVAANSRAPVYSESLTDFAEALVEGNVERSSQLLVPQLYQAIDHTYRAVDDLQNHLALELENGRLVRLLAKLEFVLNRKDAFDPKNPNYTLVLFKQYVFKQKTEAGKPSLNLAHAVMALNKLDVGIDENILLVSEDSKTRIVVSYKELKHMFSAAFEALVKEA